MKFLWQQIPSPIISEILCQNSFDGIVIDTEHGGYNTETLSNCIQVITLNKKKCFVRLTEVNKTLIRQCLDAGCDGLIFSTIENVKQVNLVKEYSLYPKYGGKRGLGLVRENLWGLNSLISKKPKLICQIETVKGIDNLPDILLKNTFDYYMIGPYDLSASIGKPGMFNSKEYAYQVKRIKDMVPGYKMAVHIPCNIEKELKKYKDYGIIALGMDTTFIIEKCKEAQDYA